MNVRRGRGWGRGGRVGGWAGGVAPSNAHAQDGKATHTPPRQARKQSKLCNCSLCSTRASSPGAQASTRKKLKDGRGGRGRWGGGGGGVSGYGPALRPPRALLPARGPSHPHSRSHTNCKHFYSFSSSASPTRREPFFRHAAPPAPAPTRTQTASVSVASRVPHLRRGTPALRPPRALLPARGPSRSRSSSPPSPFPSLPPPPPHTSLKPFPSPSPSPSPPSPTPTPLPSPFPRSL